jgi:hypothetical protein
VKLGPSDWSLIFDTETMPELGQPLRILAWQVRRKSKLIEQGIGYDLAQLTNAELECVYRYAADTGCPLLEVTDFIEDVFFPIMWERRGTVIGFNLPFDLTRLAIDHSAARTRGRDTSMRGGFSLQLSKDPSWPHVQIKRINPRAAFIRCVMPRGNHPEARNRRRGGTVGNHRGYFADVSTWAGALVGGKPKLKKLAELLNTRTRKTTGDHWAPITAEYLDYARNDVQVTWECYEKLRDRYHSYRLTDTPIFDLYSAASVGKAHLRQLGVQGWQQVQPDAPDWLIAAIMESYYGARNETRTRRHPVPVVSTDLTSQYPTGCVLM